MTIYKNILLAVDLSPGTFKPLEKAVAISKQNNAQIDIMHVTNISTPYTSQAYMSNVQEMIYNEAELKLSKICDEYNIPKINRHLVVGSPVEYIVKYSFKFDCDLIIVGTHKEHHLFTTFWGTTISNLLTKVECDILAVPTF